jgi:7,8-dihydropterin-6-yl-methyl-4-(beta-D-ribofuranosyl)aminobenzene 5'-phosphate synthase
MPIEKRTVRRIGALMILLAPLVCLPVSADEPAANAITVVYNHTRAESAADLQPGGGFGAFVEFNGKVILFDTGGQADFLLQNIKELKEDASRIEAVVISHNHWDHVYGLPGVLSVARDRPTVYVPDSSREGILQQNPRGTVVAVDGPTEIMPKVWLTGSMKLEYRGIAFAEQALVLDHEDGLVVLVGCSHPGIVAIVDRVREMFKDKKILFVGGGFHLRSTSEEEVRQISLKLKQDGVERLAPSHCTGDAQTDIFRQEWGEKLVSLDLGDSFKF